MKASAKIGSIEFHGDEVRLAVVKTGRKLPTVLELHAARAVYAEENEGERFDAFVQALKGVLSRIKNRPSLFVLSGSCEWSVVRLVRVPFKGRRRVAEAVRFELEPYLAIPIDDLVIDFIPVRELDGETEVLTVGMRANHLAEQVAILEAAGVNAEGIGIDAAGQTALWQNQKKGFSGLNAVLHLRVNSAILAVISGKHLAYYRHIGTTAAQFHENPMVAAKEVNNILRAFLARWTEKLVVDETKEPLEISSLTITGVEFFEEERALFEEQLTVPVYHEDPSAQIPGLEEAFGQLNTPVLGEDAESIPVGFSPPEKNEWLGPIGVADSASGGPYLLNFRKGELDNARPFKALIPHMVFSVGLALIASLGYAAFCFVDYSRNIREIDRIGDDIWENFTAAFPDHESAQKRPSQDIGGIRTHAIMAEAIEDADSLRDRLGPELFSKPTLLDIMAEIAKKMPDDKISITEIRVDAGRFAEITISGQVKDPSKFDEVFADLQQSHVFKVQVEKLRRTAIGGKESFVIFAKQ